MPQCARPVGCKEDALAFRSNLGHAPLSARVSCFSLIKKKIFFTSIFYMMSIFKFIDYLISYIVILSVEVEVDGSVLVK